MGSLLGHIVPGSAFGLIAIYWIIDYLTRYYERFYSKGKQDDNSPVRWRPTARILR